MKEQLLMNDNSIIVKLSLIHRRVVVMFIVVSSNAIFIICIHYMFDSDMSRCVDFKTHISHLNISNLTFRFHYGRLKMKYGMGLFESRA